VSSSKLPSSKLPSSKLSSSWLIDSLTVASADSGSFFSPSSNGKSKLLVSSSSFKLLSSDFEVEITEELFILFNSFVGSSGVGVVLALESSLEILVLLVEFLSSTFFSELIVLLLFDVISWSTIPSASFFAARTQAGAPSSSSPSLSLERKMESV